MVEVMSDFIYNYLEWIVGGGLGIGVVGYMTTKIKKSSKHPSSNLRRYVVKYKKQQDSINKQVKGIMG